MRCVDSCDRPPGYQPNQEGVFVGPLRAETTGLHTAEPQGGQLQLYPGASNAATVDRAPTHDRGDLEPNRA